MAHLRAPGGCAWDRAQTHESLRPFLLEEAYEAADAIDDPARLCDELGDVLLQVIFHAQMAAEAGTFKIDDVVRALHDKLIRRHPHVFGPSEDAASATTPDTVKARWDALKRAERAPAEAQRASRSAGASSLDEVPASLPALMESQKLQRRAALAGCEWPTVDAALAKVDEELAELRSALGTLDAPRIHEEVGDTLMTVVKIAALGGADAEVALRDACRRFRVRFTAMERAAAADGKSVDDLSLPEMERLWQDAKRTAP
ncbi:MAG: nucleoside triphosphate pyrophosphohydrolase [Armatimonadetes bacterium]|nr:nucleoside triphosphate pyrophosphohydrolase [Armatimonadota bacterium]